MIQNRIPKTTWFARLWSMLPNTKRPELLNSHIKTSNASGPLKKGCHMFQHSMVDAFVSMEVTMVKTTRYSETSHYMILLYKNGLSSSNQK